MSCDVGEMTESLENELCLFTSSTSQDFHLRHLASRPWREHKGHSPKPRTEIKKPYSTGNRTRAGGLEDRDSTDHATATGCDCQQMKVLSLFDFGSTC